MKCFLIFLTVLIITVNMKAQSAEEAGAATVWQLRFLLF